MEYHIFTVMRLVNAPRSPGYLLFGMRSADGWMNEWMNEWVDVGRWCFRITIPFAYPLNDITLYIELNFNKRQARWQFNATELVI